MNEEKENNKKDERQNYTDDINYNEEYDQQNEKKEDVNDSTFEDIIPEEDYKRIRTNIINESILINEINKYNSAKGEDSTDKLIHTKILSLENRKILIIQNMNLFKSLEELHLDNNLIEELENLDELVNLKILSVSNNKIKEIKNLKNLKNLEELNLHNNRIKKIENLNNNKKLKILILSKNYIEDIENIIYLRCLKELKFLNLEDNPICNVDNVDIVNNINNVTNEVKCKLKSIKYFNNEILASYKKKKDQTHVNTTTMCATRNNEFEFCSLNSAIDNKEIYEKKILEAFLYDITILAKSLFEDTKEPVVLSKIYYYPQIKQIFLEDLHKISSTVIDQVLLLNEERKKCSEIFEDDVENFISAYMLNNVKEYNTLRKRAKKVIHSLLSFLNCKQGLKNMELKKCPEFYKEKAESNKNKTLNDTIVEKLQNISKNFHLNIYEDKEMINESDKNEPSDKSLFLSDEKQREKEKDALLIDEDKYILIKTYIEDNIEQNFLFRDKLINEELMNIVSLNNFIENFKIDISKIIKVINDHISDYFKKLEELEESFSSSIVNFFTEVKNNEHPSVVLSEDEINEYYSYKGNRSNILNNLEDFISSSYNKSYTFLIEEKKKYLFLKSRDRITEIGKIVDTFNDLFYSYLSTLRVK
ncbi:hypothetical protein MKS88_002090 [Plasmodium brasilianum]|uniref:Leucine-rich repeat protein, putative n=2 Tax=Plasmodium (Plasmodium) TaxID=418103 RepID=A0A1A8XCP9_PLAMA|nr:leucine-rich repeat protein, putative [Plasmodium malariae]KAI4839535.1 hypothetical protein MKS88_002090 [Plasmodium brasilianum]SBT01629.1 hypothetical protein PMALA_082680 [Plasmodium malariae]SBT87955.1 leucine-rich repeat protein, putative [Plasmodium malariae]